MAYRQFRNTLILIVAVMTIAISLVTLTCPTHTIYVAAILRHMQQR